MQKLFTLRYALHDGSSLAIVAYHTGEFDDRGTAKVTIEAKHTSYPTIGTIDQRKHTRAIWSPGETWCHPSPFWTLDSPEMRKLVTELVTYAPCENDDRTFAQRLFAKLYADDLECQASSRYGDI